MILIVLLLTALSCLAVLLFVNDQNKPDFSHIQTVPTDALVSFFDGQTSPVNTVYAKISHPDHITQVVAINDRSAEQVYTLKPRLFFDMKNDRSYVIDDLKIVFKSIPSGTFTMGDDLSERSKPARKMFVNAFRIMEHEVTWALYQLCVNDDACPAKQRPTAIKDNHPVTGVSWQQIHDHFIPWFNHRAQSKFRLPSEAEWEYVASSAGQYRFAWGDEIQLGLANCWGCGSDWDNVSTSPVMSFAANDFGVYDMQGNVWEWTADCYAQYQQLSFRDSRANTTHGCDRRVIRGGGYRFKPMFMDATFRGRDVVDVMSNADGFRLAQGNH